MGGSLEGPGGSLGGARGSSGGGSEGAGGHLGYLGGGVREWGVLLGGGITGMTWGAEGVLGGVKGIRV